MFTNIYDICQKYNIENLKRLIAYVVTQCISMNFSESTVERGLTHHCYHKHKLNVH